MSDFIQKLSLMKKYDNEINKAFVEWLHDKFGVTYWF